MHELICRRCVLFSPHFFDDLRALQAIGPWPHGDEGGVHRRIADLRAVGRVGRDGGLEPFVILSLEGRTPLLRLPAQLDRKSVV